MASPSTDTATKPRSKRQLTRREKVEKADRKFIQHSVGWKSKHMTGRRMAHDDQSNFEAPEGFQIESPEWQPLQDGLERLQLFRGIHQEAVTDGLGREVDHVIRKYLDQATGEYRFMLPELKTQGFTVRSRKDGLWAEKEVTIQEAFEERLEIMGKIGGKVLRKGTDYPASERQPDSDPNTFWRREAARRAENENPTLGWRRGEQGKRDRKDSMSVHQDPEDVPWGDDPASDPYGQGVQTIDLRDEKGNLKGVFWLQERPVYGPVEGPDGTLHEGVIGREQLARPFSDLIMTEDFQWWEVLDEARDPIEGLSPKSFGDSLWEFLPELKRRVDRLEEAQVRGTGHFPWGEPFVRMMVRIPEEMKAEAGILLSIEKYSRAAWFIFNVKGPAVPALKDEFEKACRKARAKPPLPEPNPERRKEIFIARKRLEAERKEKAQTLRKTWEERLRKGFWPPEPEDDDDGERIVREVEFAPLPEDFTGRCEVCHRKIDIRRIQNLRRLLAQSPTMGGSAAIIESLKRCTRLEEVHAGDRVRTVRAVYCDGTDLQTPSLG